MAKTQAVKPGTQALATMPNTGEGQPPEGDNPNALVEISNQMPDFLREKLGQQARGNENVGADDLVIPRLEVVQILSKALEEGHAMYIEGAKPGDLINSVTRRIYGREAYIVPVHFSKQYLVWKDINKGGGFFGAFNTPDEAEKRAEEEGGVSETTGIDIIDTPVHLGLLVDRDAGGTEEIMLSMPRTKAKISRQWNTQIRLAGGDRFSRVYKITTTMEEKGAQKYWNFVIAQLGFPRQTLYTRAEKLFEQINSGKVKRTMDVRDFDPGSPTPEETKDM